MATVLGETHSLTEERNLISRIAKQTLTSNKREMRELDSIIEAHLRRRKLLPVGKCGTCDGSHAVTGDGEERSHKTRGRKHSVGPSRSASLRRGHFVLKMKWSH